MALYKKKYATNAFVSWDKQKQASKQETPPPGLTCWWQIISSSQEMLGGPFPHMTCVQIENKKTNDLILWHNKI